MVCPGVVHPAPEVVGEMTSSFALVSRVLDEDDPRSPVIIP